MSSCTNDAKSGGGSGSGGSGGIKKRGRKPKGGKIIPINPTANSDENEVVENIILHLKCSRTDINACDNFCIMNSFSTNPTPNQNQSSTVMPCDSLQMSNSEHTENMQIQSSEQTHASELYGYNYNFFATSDSNNNKNDSNNDNENVLNQRHNYSSVNNCNEYCNVPNETNSSALVRIQNKLHEIQYNYRNNTNYNTFSMCFWCTCSFNNNPIHIPKNVDTNGSFNVYGHFCMLECALAYLMDEHIDSSIKYERSALLHYKYKDSYDCNNGIKPAPPPHYILNKFYGNLTIEEYRMLYKTSKLVMVINKPITKVFPEIHEDNVDFVMKSKTIPAHNDSTNGCKLAKTSPFSNFVIVR